jgi:hypothetical protein
MPIHGRCFACNRELAFAAFRSKVQDLTVFHCSSATGESVLCGQNVLRYIFKTELPTVAGGRRPEADLCNEAFLSLNPGWEGSTRTQLIERHGQVFEACKITGGLAKDLGHRLFK